MSLGTRRRPQLDLLIVNRVHAMLRLARPSHVTRPRDSGLNPVAQFSLHGSRR